MIRVISQWVRRHWTEAFALACLTFLFLFVFWTRIVYSIPPGYVGVMWYRFFDGTEVTPGAQLKEGVHLIFPWDRIYQYNSRLQRVEEIVSGLSIDGLDITVTASSRFVINNQFAGYLHKSLGPNYTKTLMRPQLRSLILTYISEHEAADLYSSQRPRLQNLVQTRFQAALANIATNVDFKKSYILLEDVLVEEIKLPAAVKTAIEEKIRVRHVSEAYDFRLQLEEKERQRKTIEAAGIRSFQEIVAPGITESYLRWRGVEATLQLAKSNNTKIVIIGGKNGLPIILNADTYTSEINRPDADGKSIARKAIPPGLNMPAAGAASEEELMSPPDRKR